MEKIRSMFSPKGADVQPKATDKAPDVQPKANDKAPDVQPKLTAWMSADTAAGSPTGSGGTVDEEDFGTPNQNIEDAKDKRRMKTRKKTRKIKLVVSVKQSKSFP